MFHLSRLVLPVIAASLLCATAAARPVELFDGSRVAGIIHDGGQPTGLAGDLLARDLVQLTGHAPPVSADPAQCGRLCIIVGTATSDLVSTIAREEGVDLSALSGQWERYLRLSIRSRRDPSRQYLLIAGSDPRGAVWGVIDLTREMGVSTWEWWADVTPRRVQRLPVDGGRILSEGPSVQYRGIFLNDEDWGLQPWAAKTYEPETGDIGPKTYARIFELMWRLKANLIWPAMHDSTKPFYQIAGNAEMAAAYGITVGTSHAEPMMRNNVREWDEAARGPFNFFTNRDAMVDYWRQRADEVKGFDNIYSIGLRGKHDSAMEGAATPDAARAAMEQVMGIQRDLLAKAQNRPADQMPQVLTLYKEVLDIYKTGLAVPDDVTLVWPEDNYGYINRLSSPREQARSGGSGVYYHISYWGRPHDYLWLATTHPALIREQMDRAWQMQARRIWVVNVGDIKPGEYLTQYFLDLAFDHRALAPAPRRHLEAWAERQFGSQVAGEVAGILTSYYDLAFERRPEFMGFSQTEPTRPIRIGDYIRTGGAEAYARMERYADLAARATALASRLPADRSDAYFQLVLYPVRAAAAINERNLTLDLAALHGRRGRANVNAHTERARTAHATIIAETAAYNDRNGGKWRGMMDMAPRRLPVFAEPAYPGVDIAARPGCVVEAGELAFVSGRPASHSLTIYSHGEAADWSLAGVAGAVPAVTAGRLDAANGFEQRVALRYDGGEVLEAGTVQCAGRAIKVAATLLPAPSPDMPLELNRIISLTAADAVPDPDAGWERVPGLGSRGDALRSRLTLPSVEDAAATPPLTFAFQTRAQTDAELRIVALPVHPLTADNCLRLGVQVDDGAVQVLDYQTHGRSEEWKENVLSNSATRTLALGQLAAGAHRIRLHALDPGFLLDRIDVRLDGAPDYYGAPPIR
ncbi:glycosyl hydrolase 115 family protein [Niveispirillum sp. KHB5.9]|uniref:glycosyl hydrolase 115 family protein n=1 Tax=Niveispirillum sp. KHB5.9 TaxID=3400269 RepID=UPI003A8AFAEB